MYYGYLLYGFSIEAKTRILKTFEQINIKFEEKQWFGKLKLWNWINASKNVVFIKELIDLGIQKKESQYNKTHIADIHNTIKPKYKFETLDDDNGGVIGQFTPPCKCPKGGFLLLRIKLNIKVKGRWKGRVCFKHILGDDSQSYAYLPIKIKQQQVVDTLNS